MGELEADIVRRAKRGDRAALNLLFERYRRPVLSFLCGMTGSRDWSEDLLQETATRAFAQLPGLREESRFSTWLFGIARNVALEKNRRRLRDAKAADLESSGADRLSDPRPNPEADAIRRQMYRAVAMGFAVLDADRRTALALRVLAEKPYQEIAEITGWSLARVKVEIHRARLEMRRRMEPFWGVKP